MGAESYEHLDFRFNPFVYDHFTLIFDTSAQSTECAHSHTYADHMDRTSAADSKKLQLTVLLFLLTTK